MGKISKFVLGAALCLAALASLSVCARAAGEMSTTVYLKADAVEITGQTEDFAMAPGGSQELKVTLADAGTYSYIWERSDDGGTTWAQVGSSETCTITNARKNTPSTAAYQYRVTVTAASGAGDSAVINVLVADDYSYREIVLRGGDVDVSAYMHSATRLVVTPIPDDAPAAAALAASLSEGCAPLIICDVSLVNQNDEVVPYFGAVKVKFHVGADYDGQTLTAFHLYNGAVYPTSGVVSGGWLTVTVGGLSPFMVEVPSSTVHTVAASAGSGGAITPSGRVNVKDGSSMTFTLLPDAGYAVDRVLVNGAVQSISGNSFTFSAVTDDAEIAVSFRAVTPASSTHSITVTAAANGTVSPSGTLSVRHGSAQTFYIYPNSGYELDRLLVNGAEVSVIGNSYTVSAAESDLTISPSFRAAGTQLPNVYLTISASAGAGGSISPAGPVRVEYGGDMYYYFIPSAGYALDKVLIDGVATAVSGNSYRFVNVVSPHTVSASYKSTAAASVVYYSITASAGEGGRVSPSGSISVAGGGSAYFSFIPDDGYELDTVRVDGAVTEISGSAYSFRNVTGSHTVRASFRRTADTGPALFTVTATAGKHGSISPAGTLQVAEGGAQTFYFIPDDGYTVDAVYVNGKKLPVSSGQYTVEDITADTSLRVSFKAIEGGTPDDACRCLWARIFGSCAICACFGRCIAPWCWLAPLLIAAAAAAGVAALVRRKKKSRIAP